MAGHKVILTTEKDKWFAKINLATSKNEYMPYDLEAPSQTALLELVKAILRLDLRINNRGS